jgi:hypothetical protein
MLDRDPRLFGLSKPAYRIHEPEVQAAIGGPTKVYAEFAAGNLRLTKDGRSTKILAPDLVDYLLARRSAPGELLPSPNPKAKHKRKRLDETIHP